MERKTEIGESWGIAMTLLEKPQTVEGVMEQFHAFTRRFGFFGNFFSESVHRRVSFADWLRDHLEELVDKGWVIRSGETYSLTEKGREAATIALGEIERSRGHINNLATPKGGRGRIPVRFLEVLHPVEQRDQNERNRQGREHIQQEHHISPHPAEASQSLSASQSSWLM